MSKFLRREAAVKCKIHQEVKKAAIEKLGLHGVFEKDEVLDELQYKAVTDAIRWDYIREFIQEEQGCELVPLASTYFKRHSRAQEIANPSRFIAGGHGKKTAGYAAVEPQNDHLVVAKLKIKHAISKGVSIACESFTETIERKRSISNLPPVQIGVDKAS